MRLWFLASLLLPMAAGADPVTMSFTPSEGGDVSHYDFRVSDRTQWVSVALVQADEPLDETGAYRVTFDKPCREAFAAFVIPMAPNGLPGDVSGTSEVLVSCIDDGLNEAVLEPGTPGRVGP